MYKFFIKNTVYIGIGSILGILLSMLKDILIANWFGTSETTDAYLAAMFVPHILFNMFSGGMLGNIFLPIFMTWKEKTGEKDASSIFITLCFILAVLFSLLILTGILIGPFFIPYLYPGFSESQTILTIELLYILFPCIGFIGLATLLKSFLNANKNYIVPAYISSGMNGMFLIAVFAGLSRYGIKGLAAATLIGASGQVLIQLPSVIKTVKSYAIKLRHPAVSEFRQGFLNVFLGNGVSWIFIHISQNYFASLLPVGSLAVLNFASRLTDLPNKLLVVPVVTPVLAEFTQYFTKKDSKKSLETLVVSFKLMLILSIPVCVVLAVFPEYIVEIIFEHGQFTKSAGLQTSGIVAITIFAFYPNSIYTWCSSIFIAKKQFSRIRNMAIVQVLIAISLNFILSRYFGLPGLGVSIVLTPLVMACISLFYIKSDFRVSLSTLKTNPYFQDILKLMLTFFATALLTYLIKPLLPAMPIALFQLTLACLITGGVYVVFLRIFKIRELKLLLKKLQHFIAEIKKNLR